MEGDHFPFPPNRNISVTKQLIDLRGQLINQIFSTTLKLVRKMSKNQYYLESFFAKLHSELALPTELQLDGVGVDFVFPLSQEQQVTTSNNK